MDLYDGAYEKLKDAESKRENTDLDDFEEFMRKVEEVNKMVHALTSSNKAEFEEASKKATVWLKNQKKERRDDSDYTEEIINDPNNGGNKTKKINKTVINQKALSDEKKQNDSESLDNLNCEEMSQEAFMRSVEEDAKKRSEDRKQRKKESDVIKAKASKAFENKDYEKALDLYNKAIDVKKDSYVLYNNRALTLLNLGLNTRALNDCETALRLNESNFKAAAFKAKAYFQMGEEEKAGEWINEVKKMFPDRIKDIEDYQSSWSEETE